MKVVKNKVLEYELPLLVSRQETGGYMAVSESLQGVLAEGETASEAISNAIDVAVNIIEVMKEEDIKVPLKVLTKPHSSIKFNTKVSVLAYA